jgi:hypothetical protein
MAQKQIFDKRETISFKKIKVMFVKVVAFRVAKPRLPLQASKSQ